MTLSAALRFPPRRGARSAASARAAFQRSDVADSGAPERRNRGRT